MLRRLISAWAERACDGRVPLSVLAVLSVLTVLAVLPVLPDSAANAAGPVRIRILQDGPPADPERSRKFVEAFRGELLELLGEEFGVTLPPESFVVGDWTAQRVSRLVDAALADPEVDLVIGAGFIVSNELVHRRNLPKPVIAPFVADPALQGAPYADGASGVPNLAYVTYSTNVRSDLELFREIVPFERLVVILADAVRDAAPELETKLRDATAHLGLESRVILSGRTAEETLARIPEDAEAIYISALMRLPEVELSALAAGLIDRKLPSFALLGRSYVERGFLAGQTTDSQIYRLARRTALYAQRILLGEDAGTLSVEFASSTRLAINMATARAIGVSPPWEILTGADRVDAGRQDVTRVISLESAIRDALLVNRDLAAAERAVEAGEAFVDVARAPLLPRIDLSADGIWVKPELARNSLGGTAERTLSATATLTQVLYADGAWAGYGVERHLQVSREAGRDGVRLDTAQAAATAYLSILVAKTLERIQVENLDRTRVNLELARVRATIGQANPGEVYRWEGEISSRRIDLIDVNAKRNTAEIELNRLLYRPLEEAYRTEDVDLLGSGVSASDPRITAYLRDPASFRILRDFMSQVALENSPEIEAFDATIAAQERILTSTGRAFWLPELGLTGEVTHTFRREGEGSEPVDPFPGPLDSEWFVGLRATYPLLEGGAKIAERRGAQRSLQEIRTQREAVAQDIEQRLRTALHRAGASYASIALAHDALAAADRNFRLVQDSYSQGAVSIVDLIEAQNNALVSESQAANSVYAFLLDLMDVERAAGFLSYLSDPAERTAFVERLDAFRAQREQAAAEEENR